MIADLSELDSAKVEQLLARYGQRGDGRLIRHVARSLNPPVDHSLVSRVLRGKASSRRVAAALVRRINELEAAGR